MRKRILTVRDVDERTWRKFRSKIEEEGLKTGDALTQAMEIWVKERGPKGSKPNPKLLLKVKPVIVGKKRVKWSQEIDETLYGLRRSSFTPRKTVSLEMQSQS
jgi:hypothetical protein